MIVLNPVIGGGLSNAKLALATATQADVLSGKTFYAGSKGLQTGILEKGYKEVSGTFEVTQSSYSATIDTNMTPTSVMISTYGSYYGVNLVGIRNFDRSDKQANYYVSYNGESSLADNDYTTTMIRASGTSITISLSSLRYYISDSGQTVYYRVFGK